jgi:hypothetical protein
VIGINITVSSCMPVAQTSSRPARQTAKAKWSKVSEINVLVDGWKEGKEIGASLHTR